MTPYFITCVVGVQVGAADTLGSMAATSREAGMAIHEAGGTDKLKELCSAASAAPAAVKKAAGRCLANMGANNSTKQSTRLKALRLSWFRRLDEAWCLIKETEEIHAQA